MARYRTVVNIQTGEQTNTPLTPEEEAAAIEADAAAEAAKANVVPQVVSPYQARVALKRAGLLGQVKQLMVDPSTDEEAQIAWEYATEIRRDSEFIASLAPALGLTSQQIDDLFRVAVGIK